MSETDATSTTHEAPLPKVDRRQHWALCYAIEHGGTVRVSAHQRALTKKLTDKGLVTTRRAKPDGIEMTVTDLGRQVAATPRPLS